MFSYESGWLFDWTVGRFSEFKGGGFMEGDISGIKPEIEVIDT